MEKNTKKISFVAGLFLLLFSAPVYGLSFDIKGASHPLGLDITNTFNFHHHFDNDDMNLTNDKYYDFRNKLNLRLVYGEFSLGGRFDLAVFGKEKSPNYKNDYRPEKVFFTVTKEHFELTLGDYYVALGRGMALSIRKIDELAVDTTLRGGKAIIRWESFEGLLSAGFVNVLNVDDLDEKRIDDVQDIILATGIKNRFIDFFTLGVNGVLLLNEKEFPPNDSARYTSIIGGMLDIPNIFGYASFYTEFVLSRRQDVFEFPAELDINYERHFTDGYGVYSSANIYVSDFTATLEFKHYDDLLLRSTNTKEYATRGKTFYYSEPPTLERDDMIVTNNSSVTGLRGKFDYNIQKSLSLLYANVAHFWNNPFFGGNTIHVYGGIEQHFKTNGTYLDLSGGWRREWMCDTAVKKGESCKGSKSIYLDMWHVDAKVFVDIYAPHSLEIFWFHKDKDTNVGQFNANHYVEGDAILTYNWAPHFSASFLYSYTTQFRSQVNPSGNKTKIHYFGGQLVWRITTKNTIRFFVGGNRGGEKCAGGVCRIFPPFEGVSLEAIVRF